MTLHIKLDRAHGTEIVSEDDQEPLAMLKSLEIGTGVRRAWLAYAAFSQFQEVADRTRKTLERYGFDVGVAS
jgi:hypothetical protein